MKASDLNLKPGDLGFTTIGGFLGWWINLGQAITGDSCRYTHVFIVISETEVLEAMPSGARIAPIDRKYDGDVYYARLPLEDAVRTNVMMYAPQRVGTKYSFLTYLSLALLNWGFRPKWLRNYIQTSKRLICSQLGDYVLRDAGYHIFDDGRDWLDVTPGDLFYGANARIIGHIPQPSQNGPEFKTS